MVAKFKSKTRKWEAFLQFFDLSKLQKSTGMTENTDSQLFFNVATKVTHKKRDLQKSWKRSCMEVRFAFNGFEINNIWIPIFKHQCCGSGSAQFCRNRIQELFKFESYMIENAWKDADAQNWFG